MVRTCTTCRCEKDVGEFYVSKGRTQARCKVCTKAAATEYRSRNPEKAKAAVAAWHAVHGKSAKAKQRAEQPEKVRKWKADFHRRHAAEIIAKVAEWRKKNPERRRQQARAESARRLSTPRGRLDAVMSTALSHKLSSGGKARRAWQSLVGYSLDELMLHLERQFTEGMSWENYGKFGWHVDHIVPKAAFNYSLPEHEDFRRCWALSNLQPLWARDNLLKGSRVIEPFQPSLTL